MKKDYLKNSVFVLLLVAISLFSNGRFIFFFAPWIFITMLLILSRKFSPVKGFLVAWLFSTVTYIFQFYNIVPLPLHFQIVTALIPTLFLSLPYLIDLLFKKYQNNFLHTLVFPTVTVIISYIFYRYINYYTTWGHIAYTQESQPILLQSVSVFGMDYITFLITWFASVCNWIYLQKYSFKSIKKVMLTYGAVFLLTIFYGGYRTVFQKSNSETVRIASLSLLEEYAIYDDDFYGLNLEGGKEKFRKKAAKLNNNLFERSIKEAEAGAKIVFWSEGNSLILKEDENILHEKASSIAKQYNIYFGIAVGVLDKENNKPYENKFVLFEPSGNKAIEYWKANPVPGFEANISNTKNAKIQKVKTPYGVISAAICYDLDFPQHLQQAKQSDILLAPSNDWKEIDPIHTNMAKFRAIEQGFNLVRQTSKGLSAGFDYTGKTISEMDYFKDKEQVLITFLPTKGNTTIYSIIGDTFIYMCGIMLFVTIFLLKRKTSKPSLN